MTPLMKGRKRLIVIEEKSAKTRARRESDVSKMARVTEGGGSCSGYFGRSLWGSDPAEEGSFKENEGNDESNEGRSSQVLDPLSSGLEGGTDAYGVSCCCWVVPGRVSSG